LKDTLIENEIKGMSSSVGTWKLRVAYLIWLINEDFLLVFTTSRRNEDIETKPQRGGIKKPKHEKRENGSLFSYWPYFDRFCIYVQNLALKKMN